MTHLIVNPGLIKFLGTVSLSFLYHLPSVFSPPHIMIQKKILSSINQLKIIVRRSYELGLQDQEESLCTLVSIISKISEDGDSAWCMNWVKVLLPFVFSSLVMFPAMQVFVSDFVVYTLWLGFEFNPMWLKGVWLCCAQALCVLLKWTNIEVFGYVVPKGCAYC